MVNESFKELLSKRFWVFEYENSGCGGLHDIQKTFDTLEEAIKYADQSNYEIVETLDSETKTLYQRFL